MHYIYANFKAYILTNFCKTIKVENLKYLSFLSLNIKFGLVNKIQIISLIYSLVRCLEHKSLLNDLQRNARERFVWVSSTF